MVKNISVLLVAMIFLVSSSGYVLFKSSCSCTGLEQTSVFVKPPTCQETFHKHHIHDERKNEIACSENECHECTAHEESCGCESPQIFFFKLKDKAVDDEVKFVVVKTVKLFVESRDILGELKNQEPEKTTRIHYTDPPPKIRSSFDFLIQIQKLKIPGLA